MLRFQYLPDDSVNIGNVHLAVAIHVAGIAIISLSYNNADDHIDVANPNAPS